MTGLEFTTRVAVQPQQASIFESLSGGHRPLGALYSDPMDTDEILRLVDSEENADRRITRLLGRQQRRPWSASRWWVGRKWSCWTSLPQD